MLLLSQDKTKLVDVCSLFIKAKKDPTDLNKIEEFMVLGTLPTGLNVRVAGYKTEAEALEFINKTAHVVLAYMAE